MTSVHRTPLVTLNPQKPVNLESWWMKDQSREQESAWRARAALEIERMCGSREFKQLGVRPVVDGV
jgi:hypothetical protein